MSRGTRSEGPRAGVARAGGRSPTLRLPSISPAHSPGPPSQGSGSPRRDRGGLLGLLLPDTVVGLAVWLLLAAALVGSSGVIIFAFQQSRIAAAEQTELAKRRQGDRRQTEGAGESAQGAARPPARPPDPKDEAARMLERIAPSIASIEDVDAGGNIIRGSGFVLQSSATESWILTNHHLVAGAMAENRVVKVRVGNLRLSGMVRSQDPERDLAVVILAYGGLPALNRIGSPPLIGDPVWGAAASGPPGASPTEPAVIGQGRVADARSEGLLIEGPAVVGTGGALLNATGQLVGVLSARYAPAGPPPSTGWAIPIQRVCERLLVCSRPSPAVAPSAPPRPRASRPPQAPPAPPEPEAPPPSPVPPPGVGEPPAG